jgi:hypothetical protein
MPVSLSRVHRKLLENTTAAARVLAESACSAALENLAVHEKDYRAHMTVEQRFLRNRLRARGRALGDKRDERTGLQGMYHLKELAAYEHWHRLLFTRFLTENHLLITDEANGSVPITLEECEELAPEMGARDGFDLACRFASLTLPGVFRRDDPVLELPIALNDQVELRKLLAKLPSDCFTADDSLGWTYQFWQAQRKDEVNASGKKIGADELSPVTQLFTEDYMVEFLLHNTLGAWWAGKLGPIQADSESEARAQADLPNSDGVPAVAWTYLRFVQDETDKTWLPVAGTFDGWPKTANLIRVLDPCMGSGHFLVFALPLLVRLRIEEEDLDPKEAVFAVLKDNLNGLELDERCTQIAAFNVALTGWKLAGYQALPQLHLACSGNAPRATEMEWLSLAGDNDRLQRGIMRLYGLFKDAPILGSLINPRTQGGNLIEADFLELSPLLNAALAIDGGSQPILGDDAAEMGVTAQGLAKAAELLTRQFTLVATNVPYVGQKKQVDLLKQYCSRNHGNAKADLATCFVERSLSFCADRGTTALVTPQNWMFLSGYTKLRRHLLGSATWLSVARLGPRAFETISGEVVNVCLSLLTRQTSDGSNLLFALDASAGGTPLEKASTLRNYAISQVSQSSQLKTPDSRITLMGISELPLLQDLANSWAGIQTGDYPRFIAKFWELPVISEEWEFYSRPGSDDVASSSIIFWESGSGSLLQLVQEKLGVGGEGAWLRGASCWGGRGIAVQLMGNLAASLYEGQKFDQTIAVLLPHDPINLPAIWAFCSSAEFADEVRKIDKKLNLTNSTIARIPFDLTRWRDIAAGIFPQGLPQTKATSPADWHFEGHPIGSNDALHVAVARLLDYHWPRQTGSTFLGYPNLTDDGLEIVSDADGIVCLPPVSREQSAANRLRRVLSATIGTFDERSLVGQAGRNGSKSKTLEEWLRDEFFEQHAKLFHDRPFIWHLWDGRSDGFHALVNYHKLNHAILQKLTYSYLGNWIQQQAEDAKVDKPGAAARLGSAQALQKKLAAILEGEAPLDIFVRWKPLKDQVQGWHPDLNDGIRQNIRPFLLAGDVGKKGAGIFRAVPLALKDKDRGNEPHRSKAEYPWFWCNEKPCKDAVGGKEFVGTRWNNVHLTLDKKRKSKV